MAVNTVLLEARVKYIEKSFQKLLRKVDGTASKNMVQQLNALRQTEINELKAQVEFLLNAYQTNAGLPS